MTSLTFDIQGDVLRLAHSQGVLRHAAVHAGRVPGHRAEDDLGVGAEDALQALLAPDDACRRIGVGVARERDRVPFVLQPVQRRRLDGDGGRVCEGGKGKSVNLECEGERIGKSFNGRRREQTARSSRTSKAADTRERGAFVLWRVVEERGDVDDVGESRNGGIRPPVKWGPTFEKGRRKKKKTKKERAREERIPEKRESDFVVAVLDFVLVATIDSQ